LELCRASSKVAYFFQDRLSLQLGEYSHTCCRKQKEGRIRDVFERYLLERMAEQCIEMFRPDIVWVFAKRGDTCDLVLAQLPPLRL
jgi:hypothetical protein